MACATCPACRRLDYRAPAGFGPPRHLHQRDDEVIELVEGQVVVWTPERSLVLATGDLVLLPKHVPHTWRAYGAEPIRFTVTFTPSGFERFFPDIERLGLVITDVAELTSVAGDAGMEILGPPLSDEEVRQIIATTGIINPIAVAHIEAAQTTVPPDRVLNEPREDLWK